MFLFLLNFQKIIFIKTYNYLIVIYINKFNKRYFYDNIIFKIV